MGGMSILPLLHRRHACHSFQPGGHIDRADLETMLQAGRLSPSSFGLEQWHFVVCEGKADKAALQDACFNQPQVGEAAAVVVILAKLADLHPDAAYARRLLQREYPGERFAEALEMYRGFHAMIDVPSWSITQCHIAAANMMTAATTIDIDSCPIGGFEPNRISEILGIDPQQYAVALLLAFGTCVEPVPEKQRLPLDELTTWR
jgi:nitroreductase